ncbi:RNA polymerase sigma factor [Clostridium sp.]|uniref:RNA polymerase sigma factor n=1 Tax=Clostridium sp. TaxID=1506 RepID=UPI002FC64492
MDINKDMDLVIVERVLKGEMIAFELLIKKYENIIFNYIYKIILNKEDSEDIAQEAFIRAYKSLYTFQRKSSFSTWLFKIASNCINSYFKKKKNYTIQYDEILTNVQCSSLDKPEEALEAIETKKEVEKLLNSLGVDQRSCIVLKYVEGFSLREISEILGISEDAVKMKIYRARKKLCEGKIINLEQRGVSNEV